MLWDVVIAYIAFGVITPLISPLTDLFNPGQLRGNIAIITLIGTTIISLLYHRLYMPVEFIYLWDLFKKIIPAFFFTFFFTATIFFFSSAVVPRHYLLLFPLFFTFTMIFLFRWAIFYFLPYNREKILILGITSQAAEIIKEAREKKCVGFEVVGFITTLDSQVGELIHDVPVLGTVDQLEKLVSSRTVDTIVVTLRNRRGKLPVKGLLQCKFRNVRVLEGTQFYESAQRKLIIDDFFKPSWFIFEGGFYRTTLHTAVKRVQGLIISFLLLICISPVLLITAILIKLESPGPIFYLQERIGKNGRKFNLIKFRSMTAMAEKESGPTFALKNDIRVTRVGRFIRKVRLDEAPQFINIFKGDMDFVGPRPEREVFTKKLEKTVPYYNFRHSVRPGLTGWAQVNYPYGENFEDSKNKLNYDLYYVKHFSWYLDLLIFLMTFREVFFGKGR